MHSARVSQPWLSFCLVSVGVFLSTMDSSMVNVALPSIMRTFETSLSQTGWVALMYLLTITVTLLFWGRVADLIGFERVYMSGMAIFCIGAIACYFAPSLTVLIFCRFVQATGASMMMASGPAIVKMVFPAQRLGRMLGLIGVATSIGLMLGPFVSGLLIHYFSWPVLFLLPVPISLTGLTLGWGVMRGAVVTAKKENAVAFDWRGFALWAAMISLFVLVLSHHAQLSLALICTGCLVAMLLLLVLARVERQSEAPLLPGAILRERRYVVALFCATLSFTVLFVALLLMPFYLDYVLGLPVDRIGLMMMAVPMAVLLVSPVAGGLHDRIGAGVLTTTGLSVCAVALFCLCFLDASSTEMAVVWRMSLLGAGQALFLSPNSASVLATVEHRYAGVASGMLATARNMGMLAGVTLAGMVFSGVYSMLSGGRDLLGYNMGQAPVFLVSLRVALGMATCLALLGAGLSAVRGKERLKLKKNLTAGEG